MNNYKINLDAISRKLYPTHDERSAYNQLAKKVGSTPLSKIGYEYLKKNKRRPPKYLSNHFESKSPNRTLIRLTESDLHKIVKESVNRILNEVGAIGKINNFDSNKSYTKLNGKYVDNRRVMDIAKKKLISIISKPFKLSISNYDDEAYGYFDEETPDGWKFEAEDIPLDLIIDDYSYDEPASWDSPGGYSDTEGHVENIDMPNYIYFCPPGGSFNDWQKIQFDGVIKDLFVKNAQEEDDISDALHSREDYERDMEAGRYDEYINNQIDMIRGN